MEQADVTITNEVGLHARPAAQFVQTAKRYTSAITLRNGDRTANAKSIMQVLTLSAKKDTRLSIEANGDDAADAVAALVALVESGFGE